MRAFLGLVFHFRKRGGGLGTVRIDFVSLKESTQCGISAGWGRGTQDGDAGLRLGDGGSVGGEVEDVCGGEVGEG